MWSAEKQTQKGKQTGSFVIHLQSELTAKRVCIVGTIIKFFFKQI